MAVQRPATSTPAVIAVIDRVLVFRLRIEALPRSDGQNAGMMRVGLE
jgi:hypothetical protein